MKTLPELARVFFQRPSALILLTASLAALGARLWQPVFGWKDVLVALIVVAVWPLYEWLLHVYTLHARPRKIGPFTYDAHVAKMHRLHHEDPWNIDLVFIPLRVFWTLPLIWAGWICSPFSLPVALTGLTVYSAMSLQYEWIHYLTHTRYVPKGWYYRRLWQNHRLHHFKNEHFWYGVTMLEGDRLLRTQPDPVATPLSPTCRSILGSAPGDANRPLTG